LAGQRHSERSEESAFWPEQKQTKFTLMELELIEPYLFLGETQSAVQELVKAFVRINAITVLRE
jgi:hypothetical protein